VGFFRRRSSSNKDCSPNVINLLSPQLLIEKLEFKSIISNDAVSCVSYDSVMQMNNKNDSTTSLDELLQQPQSDTFDYKYEIVDDIVIGEVPSFSLI
jgi:hypothetical protein